MNELFLNVFGFLAIISLTLFGIIIVQSILSFLKAKKDMRNFLKFYYQISFVTLIVVFLPGSFVAFDTNFYSQLPDGYFVKSYYEFSYALYHGIFKSQILTLLFGLFLASLLFFAIKDPSKKINERQKSEAYDNEKAEFLAKKKINFIVSTLPTFLWLFAIYGMYVISPLIHSELDKSRVEKETGHEPAVIINSISIKDLNNIVDNFAKKNGAKAIIFRPGVKIIIDEE